MKKMLAVLVAALSIPFAAEAAPTARPASALAVPSPYYASLKLGMYMPQADDMDALGFNNGFASDLQVGRRITQNFAVEGGLGWFRSTTDEVDGAEATLSVIPITVSAKGILPVGQAELYGLGGVGLYMSSVKIEGLGGSISDDDSSLGLHAGIGGQYAVTSQLSVGLEARYLVASVNDADINGLMLNAGVAFNF